MNKLLNLFSFTALLQLSLVVSAGAQAFATRTGVHVLQDGTPIKLYLTQAISSQTAHAGQEMPFQVVDDLVVEGVTVLKRGTPVIAVVTEAVAKKRLGRPGKLNFRIPYVQLADGEKVNVRAFGSKNGTSYTSGAVEATVKSFGIDSFFLLLKGEEVSFAKGTQLSAWINGDAELDLGKFQSNSQDPSKR
jgi:hypothetical protein